MDVDVGRAPCEPQQIDQDRQQIRRAAGGEGSAAGGLDERYRMVASEADLGNRPEKVLAKGASASG
jgi:hypothetical protein